MATVTMMVAMAVDAVALGEKVLYLEQMYLISLTYMPFILFFSVPFHMSFIQTKSVTTYLFQCMWNILFFLFLLRDWNIGDILNEIILFCIRQVCL